MAALRTSAKARRCPGPARTSSPGKRTSTSSLRSSVCSRDGRCGAERANAPGGTRGVMDDELLKDFLTEAGELIESLDADLIGLEASPNDRDVLNGVFRAFHTIKGGAGFLGLKALVDVCHRAEDLLNLARSDVRPLGAEDIDLVLRSIDEVKRMFGELAGGEELKPAPETLLAALEQAVDSPAGAADSESARETAAEAQPAPVDDDPVLASFEAMLVEARSENAEEA